MALKLMPGETRNYTFKLPDEVANIDSMLICFFQNDEKILEYTEAMQDKVFGVENQPNLIVCVLPREDTLKFENRMPAKLQMEWNIDGRHSVSKAQRISVGNYLNKEYVEGNV